MAALTWPQSACKVGAMSQTPRPTPTLSHKGLKAREARAERLAKALRDNLKKRKAQQRGRAGGCGPEHDPPRGGKP
jgi:hypothetical protein